jgi:hypothetical protein
MTSRAELGERIPDTRLEKDALGWLGILRS